MNHSCCICRDLEIPIFYKQVEGFSLLKCKRCGLIYSDHLPPGQESFFDDSQKEGNQVEYWSTPKFFDEYKPIFDKFFHERLERMKRLGITSGDVLDIGTGYGLWADYLRNHQFNVEGIEVSRKTAKYANDTYGFSFECISIEQYQTSKKFDVICMFDVLEHLEQPEIILRKISGWLKPNGIIYLQVPNVIGLRYPYGHGLGLPYHIWQFNPITLKKVVTKAGMKPQCYWTGTQGVIGAHKAGKAHIIRKLAWKFANLLKIGNRVQLICSL